MKLKKIASLMLAGIMAVSMLAACGEGKKDDSSSSSSTPTTQVSGLAEILNANRTNKAKNDYKLTYTDSSSLADILSTIANDKYGKDSGAVKTIAGTNSYGDATWLNDNSVVEKINSKVTGGVSDCADLTTAASSEGTDKFVRVFTVGGNYDLKAAGNRVAVNGAGSAAIENSIVAAATGYTSDYSAEVAAVKVTSNDDASVSAWVIAIVYTRTTKAA